MEKSEKILVVDDEKSIRILLSEVLSGAGFEVSMARDGKESLDQMAGRKFDLVITDVHMPILDGIEMLRRMKKAGRREKVIIMTGDPSDERFRDADIPPVVTRLQKPFRMDNLLNVVVAAMANGTGECPAGVPSAM
ncbi:MAG: response regulator [Deltaproteobacteria bacterium]|nr:MAG: response regulator [Deltaproteobacteria bacterium]